MVIYNNLLLGERINAFVNCIWIIWFLFNAVRRTVRPGKIPEFDTSEYWQLPILIEQYRNRNVDTYLNSRCWSPLQFVMTELLNCAGMTNNRCVCVVVVFILYSKLKVMLCRILRLFILLLGVYNSLVVLHCRSTFCDIKMCDWYRFISQLRPNCLGQYFFSKDRTVLCKFLPKGYSHDLS